MNITKHNKANIRMEDNMQTLDNMINKQAQNIVKNLLGSNISVLVRDLNEDAIDDIKCDAGDAFEDVCEWWFVDESLGERLEDKGEVAFRYGFEWMWGRQTSGQAVYMDSVIEKIAEDSVRIKLETELNYGITRNDWEGMDSSIEHSLDYGALWIPDGENGIRLFIRADHNKWNWASMSNTPDGIIADTPWAKWNELFRDLNKPRKELTLQEVITHLQFHGTHVDICGECYSGFMSENEVLWCIAKKGFENE
jgi:hypothetical protein